MDAVIIDELGYLPFAQSGGALLFHLLSELCEKTLLQPSSMAGVVLRFVQYRN
jgi:DNA replication protein DnaC